MRSVCQGAILAASLALALSFTPSPRTGTFRTQIHVTGPSNDVSTAESESKDASRPAIDTPLRSSTFGSLTRIRMPGEDDASFLGAMGVPTYATMVENDANSSVIDTCKSPKARGLEGVINQGPAFMLDNVLSKEVCESMIRDCDELGFGNYKSGRNHHGALQILVSPELANAVGQRLSRHVDVSEIKARRAEMMEGSGTLPTVEEDVRLVYAGLNRRWRIYRYDSFGNETFAPHIDAGFPPSGLSKDGKELLWDASDPDGEEIVSRLTVLMYLNDDFVGGETNFYQPLSNPKALSKNDEPAIIASVRPVAGSCLVFPQGVGEEAVDYARKHWPLHEGSPVLSGRPKYVVRSDVLFATQKEALPLDDVMLRYDWFDKLL